MAFRLDIGSLKPARRLSNGTLRVDGHLARTGVQIYLNPDGTERREYRPPEEVFRADSLSSFALVPVTDDHPPTMLDARNCRMHAVGSVGESVRADGNHVMATLAVFDADTIAKMEAGKVDLSCGYEADIIDESGVTPEGEPYDSIQRNIRGNHVAIVDRGRAGSARVRMDGVIERPQLEGPVMDELQKKLAEALVKIATESSRADQAEASLAAERTARATVEAELSNARKDAEAAAKQRADADSKAAANLDARVQARVDLLVESRRVLGEEFDPAKHTDRQIKVAVIAKVDSETIADDVPDVAVDLLYKGALKRAGGSALAEARATITPPIPAGAMPFRADADDTEAKARRDMQARAAKAYQNPTEGN